MLFHGNTVNKGFCTVQIGMFLFLRFGTLQDPQNKLAIAVHVYF